MSDAVLTRRNALLLLGVVVLAWGFTWVVNKLLLQYMTPIWAAAARSIAGTAALLALGLALRRVAWPVKADLPVILSVGLLHMGAFAALVSLGLQHVPAGRSVVLAYTTPLWVIPAAWLFLGEPIGRGRQAGLALGMLGLIVIFNPFAFDWRNREALVGNGLILAGALCWAANIVYVRAHRWVTPPFELAFWQALLASGVLSAVAFAAEGPPGGGLECGPGLAAGLRRHFRDRGRVLGGRERQSRLARGGDFHRVAGRAGVRPAVRGRDSARAGQRLAAGGNGLDRGRHRGGGGRPAGLTVTRLRLYRKIYILRYVSRRFSPCAIPNS